MELQAEVEAMGPEGLFAEGEFRLERAARLTETLVAGHLQRIDVAIDRVARPQDVAPYQERVAGLQPRPRAQVDAEVEAHLADGGEGRAEVAADVGGQSQDAARRRLVTAARAYQRRRAIDPHVLLGHAEGKFAVEVEEEAAPAPAELAAHLEAVELVGGLKAIE